MHTILQVAEDEVSVYPHHTLNPAARIYSAIKKLEGHDCGFVNPIDNPAIFWRQWRDTYSADFHCEERRHLDRIY